MPAAIRRKSSEKSHCANKASLSEYVVLQNPFVTSTVVLPQLVASALLSLRSFKVDQPDPPRLLSAVRRI